MKRHWAALMPRRAGRGRRSRTLKGPVRSASTSVPLAEAYRIENEVSAAVMSSKDAREGPRAFKEKRKPKFTGE